MPRSIGFDGRSSHVTVQEFAQGRHDSAEVQRTLGPPMRRKDDGERPAFGPIPGWTSAPAFGEFSLRRGRPGAGVEFSEDTLADDR
jgi:hypothetical protein